jgi:Dyp-type peroxidase family
MPLTLNETDVKSNAQFDKMLKDLQGNILKHHGRTHAFHLFFIIKPAKKNAAKQWLKKFASTQITSSLKQLKDAASRNDDPEFDGGVFFNVSLSKNGYSKLGVATTKIPDNAAFNQGMRNRKANNKNILADMPTQWETGFKKQLDGMVLVADANISRITTEKDKMVTALKSFADVVVVQKGKVLKNKFDVGIEHFGYADGVSQPNYLEPKPTDPIPTIWDDNHALLKNVLVKDKGGSSTDSFGSYFVFRKLEQNVAAFKGAEEKISEKFNNKAGVKDVNGTPNDELAGSMIVGRFEDGSEVINHSKEKPVLSGTDLNNDFDYSSDATASKCPFHAHIRISNPRADIGQDAAKQIRITRRGIPFNDIGRDEHDLDNDKPTGGVGLLFMCYNSSIENQFEIIQGQWANKGDVGTNHIGQDGIIGQGINNRDRKLPSQWGTNNDLKKINEFKNFVTMKGGEYFFTPSISFLKNL